MKEQREGEVKKLLDSKYADKKAELERQLKETMKKLDDKIKEHSDTKEL